MRLFIACAIPDAVKECIARTQERLRKTVTDVRWVECEKFHLTLKFLGEVPEEHRQDIERAVARAAAGEKPFTIELAGLGAFPSVNRPRVVWVGVRQGADRLAALAGAVDAQLEPLGFAKETRPFSAHLTIGRVRSPRNIAELTKKIDTVRDREFGICPVTAINIMQSILNPHGAQHLCLRSLSI